MDKPRWFSQLTLVLFAAFALKLHYSLGSPDQLRWILAPTTWLVQLVSGTRFHFESFAGYMSSDRTFLIATSCAGVNFLIASFLMLALRRLWINRNCKTSWSFIPLTAAGAFFATLLANTTRISIALWMQHASSDVNWLSRDQVHRIEGIVVYFAFLLLLFWLSEREFNPKQLLLPLIIYYMIALLLPVANLMIVRSPARSQLGEHLLLVLLVPVLLLLPVTLYRRACLSRNSAPTERGWY